MKKRNLLLSLICSIVLAVALVTFTVITIVPPKTKNNKNQTSQNVSDTENVGEENTDILLNEGRDGSESLPYIIYSVETFKTFVVDKYLDDEGNYIDYNKTNGNGDYKYPMLKAGLNYELYRDIDFAGTEFETLFNKGIPFNGKIDGKGYALKNININVEKANFEKYIAENNDGRYVSHVGIFGELKNAIIKDVKFENVSITVADDVYSYVKSGDFATMMGATLKELTVGSLAAISTNGTKIEKVEVSGTINAGAYSLYAVDYVQGYNAVGGVIAVANDAYISEVKTNMNIIATEGKNYFVGGVSGYANNTSLIKSTIVTNVQTSYKQALYVGGVFGHAVAVEIDETEVFIDVNDVSEERFDTRGVSQINDSEFVWIAGAIVMLHAENNEDITYIKDVNIFVNADIDGIYAGAVMDITSNASNKVINIENVIVEGTVGVLVDNKYEGGVLKAYGFARKVNGAVITLNDYIESDEYQIAYNVKFFGKVRLNKNTDPSNRILTASVFIGNYQNTTITNGFVSVRPIVSFEIYSQLEALDTVRMWGNKVSGTTNWVIQ